MIQTYLGLLSASLGRASNKDTDLPHDLKAADADLMVWPFRSLRTFEPLPPTMERQALWLTPS